MGCYQCFLVLGLRMFSVGNNAVIDAMQHTVVENHSHPELDLVMRDTAERLEGVEGGGCFWMMRRSMRRWRRRRIHMGWACVRAIADVLKRKEYREWK